MKTICEVEICSWFNSNCIPVLQTSEAAHEGRSTLHLPLIHSTLGTHASPSAPAAHKQYRRKVACKHTLNLSYKLLFVRGDFNMTFLEPHSRLLQAIEIFVGKTGYKTSLPSPLVLLQATDIGLKGRLIEAHTRPQLWTLFCNRAFPSLLYSHTHMDKCR